MSSRAAHIARYAQTAGDTDDSTELAIAMTFSGGGTHAAAFALDATD